MRAIWSGAISFGLIHIPVKLYSASQSGKINLHYLRRQDLCPIRYARICRLTGEEVQYKDLVKGYEYQEGDFVVLEDKDFQRASKEKYQTINIFKFVKQSEVDEKFLEKPYYLEPTKEARRVYALLREALKRSNKVGLARFMLRTREYFGELRADEDILVLNSMRFHENLREPTELNVPGKEDISKQELDMALSFINQMTASFDPSELADTYQEELEKTIKAKKEGKLPKLKTTQKFKPAPDILEQLKKSLELAKNK